MSQSDRLYLEDGCPTLLQLLERALVKEVGVQLVEQEIQDFEVGYSIQMEGSIIKLKIMYPFLSGVLKHGSQQLLEHLWSGLPLELQVRHESGELDVTLDVNGFQDDEVALRCAQRLASTRTWLLTGPLMSCLSWLQQATDKTVAAGAAGSPPQPIMLQFRQRETCWIVPKQDRVLVILSVDLDDEADVALGRAFCQEFAENKKKGTEFSLPCSFHEPKDAPSEVRGIGLGSSPNVGFLTLTLTDQHVQGASEERLLALSRPVMTFRNFFQFHLKHTKSFLHSRLRKRLDHWHQQLKKARRRRAQEKRRLISGKEFVPPSRVSA
eukprot:TRINITY_DN36017_c0_g1_i1.p1 TRINITY_DN36017_c0_g1~~TRINITY_DN36017_c0_g1_i1.p1  ORF type:complete len:324 (+),score=57.74 TRINITY_DN36017_c0_g1_i1:59-1030(+)